jgi:hypothetical protein
VSDVTLWLALIQPWERARDGEQSGEGSEAIPMSKFFSVALHSCLRHLGEVRTLGSFTTSLAVAVDQFGSADAVQKRSEKRD